MYLKPSSVGHWSAGIYNTEWSRIIVPLFLNSSKRIPEDHKLLMNFRRQVPDMQLLFHSQPLSFESTYRLFTDFMAEAFCENYAVTKQLLNIIWDFSNWKENKDNEKWWSPTFKEFQVLLIKSFQRSLRARHEDAWSLGLMTQTWHSLSPQKSYGLLLQAHLIYLKQLSLLCFHLLPSSCPFHGLPEFQIPRTESLNLHGQ